MKYVSSNGATREGAALSFTEGGRICVHIDESQFQTVDQVVQEMKRLTRKIGNGGFDLSPEPEKPKAKAKKRAA